MYDITVLMSTYNGRKYIDKQIMSILNQEGVNVKLIIRDDGSTDGTYEYIKHNYPNINVIKGKNIGYKQSFMTLLRKADRCEYYAFADQDDIWKREKLRVGIEKLRNFDRRKPNLYCSNLTVVDENLNYKYMNNESNFKEKVNKMSAVLNDICFGCTAVFNYEVKRLVEDFKCKDIPHDGFICLFCMFFGNVYYDNNSYIYYRQHSSNVYGSKSGLKMWYKKLKNFLFGSTKHYFEYGIKEFLTAYSDKISKKDLRVLLKLANYRRSFIDRLKLLFDNNLRKIHIKNDLCYRIRVISGRV